MSGTENTTSTASRLRGAAGGLLRRRQGAGALPRLVEIALVVLIAFLLSRIIFGLAPGGVVSGVTGAQGPATSLPPADMTVFARFDPFAARAVTAQEETVEAEETSLDITLTGIWPDNDGTGIAIISTGSREPRMYTVGEEIMDGVLLDRVYPYHAIILRNGRRESVFLARRDRQVASAGTAQPVPMAQTPDAAPLQGGQFSASSLGEILTLRPVVEGNEIVGYQLFPRDESRFAALGLVSGDLVMRINGEAPPTSPEGIASLVSGFEGEAVTLVLDRQGVRTNVTLDLSELE